MRVGISALEFWRLTPAETFAAIEAANWRQEQDEYRDAWSAWHAAALMRTKRMPSFKRFVQGHETRALEGEELEKRRAEKREMQQQFDVAALNAALAKKNVDS